jgi:glyoxylase-like metal-dependent hydrolase (beta-lactamase superfamily II)
MTDRRQFLRVAGGCLAHVLLQGACASPARRRSWAAPAQPVVSETPFARLEAIGAGAWAVISTPLGGDRTTFANGGLIAGRHGVVAIEGFYRPAGATWLAEQARRLTGRWPTHVLISHYHVDHAAGVSGYGAASGAAPHLCATALTQDAVLRGGPVAPPREAALLRPWADVVLTGAGGATTLDLGDRVLTLHARTGHTASDLVIEDADAGLLFSGDLVWNGMFPNFVDADPRAWRASAQWLAERGAARLVPGHGGLTDRAALDRFAALLDDLEAAGRRAHANGRPAADAATDYRVPDTLGDWMASPAAVTRAFAAWYRVLGTSEA